MPKKKKGACLRLTVTSILLTNAEYYTWEKFADDLIHLSLDEIPWTSPVDFDSRFSYYSTKTNLTDQLSREDLRETTETREYPWGRLDYICSSKTIKSVSVSVFFEINLKTI